VLDWDLRDLVGAYIEAVKVHERERYMLSQVLWQMSRINGGKRSSQPPKPPRILTEE
jgi:hypothetical protein